MVWSYTRSGAGNRAGSVKRYGAPCTTSFDSPREEDGFELAVSILERRLASGALLEHLEAQLVGLNELGLHIKRSVTFFNPIAPGSTGVSL
jgi:hypothetical protein